MKHRWPAVSRFSFSLNIGIVKSLRDGNQQEMCLEDESRERKTERERESEESLLRHLHQLVVRRVMNLVPLLPSNQ